MPTRAFTPGRRFARSLALVLAALLAWPLAARAQPTAHHPGEWTTAQYWPGTGSLGVQAVHMALVRGDTLFARPHSQVLAWGSWDNSTSTFAANGGLWGWRPLNDVGAAALGNLDQLALAAPPYTVFCAGHTTIPDASGDLLIVGGQDRVIAGEAKSLRYRAQERQWGTPRTMNSRRWYGVGTAMPWSDGTWRVLATAGLMYDHLTVFGGRRSSDGALTSDLERYQLTKAGGWDPALSGSGLNWPVPREYGTLVEQGTGPHYLFGGRAANDSLRSDVWHLRRKDIRNPPEEQTYVWTQQFPVADDNQVGTPSPRWQHAAVVDKLDNTAASLSTMYVFGGEDASGPLDEVWRLWWHAAAQQWKWSRLTPTGAGPSARSGATAVWDEPNNRMIVFGGAGANGALADNDVYILDTPDTAPSWRVAPLAEGSDAPPSPRALHAMAADQKLRLVTGRTDVSSNWWFHCAVFGGDLESGAGVTPTSELWRLFVQPGSDSVCWRNRTPAGGPAPAARTGASAFVYDTYPLTFVTFGGQLAAGSDAQGWELPLDSGEWLARAPLSGHALHGQMAVHEREPFAALQPEVYDALTDSWQDYGDPKYQFSYHMMFAGSDGGLWYPGPNFGAQDRTWRFDPVSGAWSEPAIPGNGHDNAATGVLYRPNRILKVGDEAYTSPRHRALPVSESLQLDESPATRRWRVSADTLALARMFHNVLVLPTGEVAAVGGMELKLDEDGNPENDNPRRRPELWDPTYAVADTQVGWWYGGALPETLAAEPVARGHHSSAILLPDGRILSGGGHDTDPAVQIRSVDAWSPPYLYRADGTAAFRPRLYGAQDHVAWGQGFEVACPDPVAGACLIRPGAATHTYNQDQRYVPLTVASQTGHQVVLNAPANAHEAPPGKYLLFVLRTDEVSGKAVPSVARWVNVGAAKTSYATYDTLAPAAVGDLQVASNTQTSFTLRWTAPADAGEGSPLKADRYEIRVRAGDPMATLEDFFEHGRRLANPPAPASAGTTQELVVAGLSPDTVYYFRLLSRDRAGSDRNWSAWSNEASAQPDAGCPFVDTETAAGWQEENSILGRSLSGALAQDAYRLRHAPAAAGGRVRLRVRENEQELTTLDELRLVAIDHAPGGRAYALGGELVLGTRVPAARVVTAAGLDVTALLDGSGAGLLGQGGDTLYVEFAAAASPPAGAFGVQTTEDPSEIIVEDGGKGGGNPLTWRAPERLGATAVDAQVLAGTGVRLEVQDAQGQWQGVAHRYPRAHADEAVYGVPERAPLRLVFVGTHRLRFVGRFVRGAAAFTVTPLPLLAATHSRLGNVRAAVDTAGARTTELAPGDTLGLEFGWSAVPEGQVRELLLLARGVYTANLPARLNEAPPPARFAAWPAQPNPFAATTALRFALPQPAHVRFEVLDAQGRRVALLADHRHEAGEHALAWDGRTSAGTKARPGVYFYRLEAGAHRAHGKLTRVP